MSRNRFFFYFIFFLVILHFLLLAEHLAEVPHRSFTGLRPQSHLCCGLRNSAVSLFNRGAGLPQPRLPGAAFNTLCVSVGQKNNPRCQGPYHLRRLSPHQKETSRTFLPLNAEPAAGQVVSRGEGHQTCVPQVLHHLHSQRSLQQTEVPQTSNQQLDTANRAGFCF